MNQTTQVLQHLKSSPITRMLAFQRYGICELSSRIGEIEAQGYTVPRRTVKLPSGKRVTEYLGVRRRKV